MTNREYIIDYLSGINGSVDYEKKADELLIQAFCHTFGIMCDSCPYQHTGCIPLPTSELNEFMMKEFSGEIKTTKIRKKGKWVKVGGYATPGGDPVWRCSVCGKGQHVYGIEASSYAKDVSDHQWLSCPNCDAEMSE